MINRRLGITGNAQHFKRRKMLTLHNMSPAIPCSGLNFQPPTPNGCGEVWPPISPVATHSSSVMITIPL
jgi:hypothetical protein